MKKEAFSFKKCMALMRKHDPQAREDGFHSLLPHAAEHVSELIAEFRTERDHGLRCWLLELIGEARSPEATTVLAEALVGDDASLRSWAIRGLDALATKEARQLLREARSYTFQTSEETDAFREELAAPRGARSGRG